MPPKRKTQKINESTFFNKLIVFTDLEDYSKRDTDMKISNVTFYKNISFDRIYLIGKFSDRINNISKDIKQKPNCEVIPIVEDYEKLFLFKRNKISKTLSLSNDPYQAPYYPSKFTHIVEKEILKYDPLKEKIYFSVEKDSWFDKHIPFNYQLSSLIKPRIYSPSLYIRETQVNNLSSFEDELYLEGIDVIKTFITSSLHIGDITQNIPGWALTPSTPWISLIISKYNIRQMTPDMPLYQELISFYKMRSLIFNFSVYEMMEKFEDKLLYPDEDEIYIISDKERIFIEKYIDEYQYKKIYKNDENIFLKWTNIDTYERIKDLILSS